MSPSRSTPPDAIPDLPLVYVSGPYRADTLLAIMHNIAGAWEDAAMIWRMGGCAICPHMNTAGFSEIFGPNSVITGEQCIQGDLVMIARCDAIFMRSGWEDSMGANIERAFAATHSIPVYYALGVLSDDIANHTIGKRASPEAETSKGGSIEPHPFLMEEDVPKCGGPMTPAEGTENPKDILGRAKIPFHLVPESATAIEAEVMRLGAEKYGAYNWRKTRVAASVYVSALRRHMSAWFDGENDDPESGLSHLAHARANLGIMLDALDIGTLEDDRPNTPTVKLVQIDGPCIVSPRIAELIDRVRKLQKDADELENGLAQLEEEKTEDGEAP